MLLAIDSDGMRKISLYFALIAVTVPFLTACGGREWDTDDEIESLTKRWSYRYVSDVLDFVFENIDSTREIDGRRLTFTASVNDTLNYDFHWKSNSIGGDSIDVTTTLIQIGDSSVLIVDGYRYSEDLWAHLFTVDPGIINFDGMFHVDFYETGKTTPWGWSEITYTKKEKDSYYRYSKDSIVVGRY